jgi:hypothetical protein
VFMDHVLGWMEFLDYRSLASLWYGFREQGVLGRMGKVGNELIMKGK